MTPFDSTQGRDRPTTADASNHRSGVPEPDNQRHSAPRPEAGKRIEAASEAREEYLSPGDAARLLCVSARTVSRWADQGRIPHLVTLGGHRRFSKANILELTRRGRRNGDDTSTARD